MLSDDTLYLTVQELGDQIQSRKISPVELTEAYLARLDKYGKTLSAVAMITRDLALDQARSAESELAAGKSRGPLHGIPCGVQDLFATRALATTWGAPPFRNQVFDYDATVIRKLRDAGAILVAKLATIEMGGGCGYTSNSASLQGATRNPFHMEHWAGGSAGGPAAAVAAGLVGFAVGVETTGSGTTGAGAIGSGTIGSILTPASYCGCSALRPTYGRVSRHGAMPLSWTMDKIGPVCRSAVDCGLVLSALAGSDPFDATSLDATFYWWPTKQAGRGKALAGKRIVAVRPRTGEANAGAFNDALNILRDLGAKIEDRNLPDYAYDAIATTICACEAASIFRPLIASGKILELADTAQQDGFIAALEIPASDYLDACRLRARIVSELGSEFETCDAFVAPTVAATAPRLDGAVASAPVAENANLGAAANLAGLPGVTVPCGFADPENLPLGLQFCCDATRDEVAIECAIAYQDGTKWHRRHPAAL